MKIEDIEDIMKWILIITFICTGIGFIFLIFFGGWKEVKVVGIVFLFFIGIHIGINILRFYFELFPKRMRRLYYGLLAPTFSIALTMTSIAAIENKSIFLLCVALFLLLTLMAITASRLRDTNSNGELALLLILPIIDILMILALIFIPGTAGDNQFGRNPKLAGVPKQETTQPNHSSDSNNPPT